MSLYISEKNTCDPNPCHNGGVCSQQGDHYKCACRRGYTGEQCKSKTIMKGVFGQGTLLLQLIFLCKLIRSMLIPGETL